MLGLLGIGVLWLFLSLLAASYAHRLRRPVILYFIVSLVLSPLIAFIALLVEGENTKEAKEEHPSNQVDELIKLSALLDKGRITQEEYISQKDKLINS